jgi:hypothetical protein
MNSFCASGGYGITGVMMWEKGTENDFLQAKITSISLLNIHRALVLMFSEQIELGFTRDGNFKLLAINIKLVRKTHVSSI